MSAQLEQFPKISPGEFIYGALELLLDPETIAFGLLAFFVLGVYAIVRLILEAFSVMIPPPANLYAAMKMRTRFRKRLRPQARPVY